MTSKMVVGVDVGTSSTKGVLVDANTGAIAHSVTLAHDVQRPYPGWAEMDGTIWWEEFVTIVRELVTHAAERNMGIDAVGVSGMGPCVLLADAEDTPVRPAILYGVDARATAQIDRMTAELGTDDIVARGGSTLTTQAAGPKIVWVAEEEPEAFARANRLFMPASWLARHLTGAYVLDHQSASQVSPLYDINEKRWNEQWWDRYAPGIEPPKLGWPGDIAGSVTTNAAETTGLPIGIPVIIGTIDAWSEGVSVGAHKDGDLLLMYGTTMFLIATATHAPRTPSMWTTVGTFPGTHCLAGGLSTSGALTSWLSELTQADYPTLLEEAKVSGVGANGLLMLPYFAGERTPILDPDARGIIAGLTLNHTRGDLYRAALEATAFGVKHNIETMRAAGADIRRIVAAGGGTQGALWLQIVSDVTGVEQQVASTTIGASYGVAFLAACARARPGEQPRIEEWNPITYAVKPNQRHARTYARLFDLYLSLYERTKGVTHALVEHQRE